MRTTKEIYPQLILWDAQTGKQRWSTSTELHELRSIAFSSDGQLIASGHEFAGLAVWDAGNGALLRIVKGHTSSVMAVAFAGETLLASAGLDGDIWL